jgi:hypothetical protein
MTFTDWILDIALVLVVFRQIRWSRIDKGNGKAYVRAGFVAASLWVLGMAARLAFAIWSEHSGGPTLVRFSGQHNITSVQAWVSGMILMVLCEVGTRVATILIRTASAKNSATSRLTSAAR